MRSRWCLAVVLVLAACGGSGPGASPTTTAAPGPAATSTSAPATTEAPTTTTTTEPVSDEDRLRLVVIDLVGQLFANRAEPDVDRVDDYMQTLCTCFAGEVNDTQRLVDLGRRYAGPPDEVRAVRVEHIDLADGSAGFTLAMFGPAVDLVDAEGTVVEHFDEIGFYGLSIGLLEEGGRDRWRISDINDFYPSQEVMEELLSHGLP